MIQRSAKIYLLVILYAILAAASFNGFYDKWGFRDGEVRYRPEVILDGTADRPFVYRRLTPWLVNAVAAATPERVMEKLQEIAPAPGGGANRLGPDFLLTKSPEYFFKYSALYYITYLELFLSLTVLYRLCRTYVSDTAAAIAPAILALLYPILLSEGGYFYDFGEIFFLSLAAYLAVKGRPILVVLAVVLGTFNKESTLFFTVALLPLMTTRKPFKTALFWTAIAVLASAVVYVSISRHYQGNHGARVEVYFLENLRYWFNPRKLLRSEHTYGVPMFHAAGIFMILLMGLSAIPAWRIAPARVRAHTFIILAINLPLFALLAFPGEMRNLSLTFVAWTLLTAVNLNRWAVQSQLEWNTQQPRIWR